MKKNKYAQHVLDNIRWFAKYRNEFDFCGSGYFHLDKVQIYSRAKGTEDPWSFQNEMSRASFASAFDWPHNIMPKFYPGEFKEYMVTCTVEPCVVHDIHGVDAIEAFIQIDSYGVVKATRHPTLLFNLLRTKASLNLHVQMYAQDRANGRLPKLLFEEEIVKPFEFLPWMIDAVENQKWNYITTTG